ncbi:MAG: hypothetical protein ACR2JG_01920 [Geodermatophilaceae bacterium]
MSEDHVDLDPQQVANGLAKWDQVAATLQSHWDSINGQITHLLTPATFGGDEPGSNFQASFVDKGQAGTLAGRGKKTVKAVDETAQKVRKAAEASLAADAEQAAKVGGVSVPGFKTGAGSGGGGGGSSAGGGSAMMSGGSSSGGTSGMMMGEKEGEAQFVSDGGMVMGEMVLEDTQLGPSDQDIMYERLPIGDTQSPYPPPGDETQILAGSGGGVQYTTDGTTSELVYDTPRASDSPAAGEAGGARETGAVNADRMTTQPAHGPGSNQPAPSHAAGDRGSDGGTTQPGPAPASGERGSNGGTAQPAPDTAPADRGQDGAPARQNSDGPAETMRERIADRIPDSIVERLPDGMAERIYEARGDYAVDVPQPIDTQPVDMQPVETQPVETQPVETRGVDSSASAVPVTGLPVEDYRTGGGGGELTVQRPR